jgi:NAD(P)-dependent dehydrogenase (short-subunit alcohol dehydrogenase family)
MEAHNSNCRWLRPGRSWQRSRRWAAGALANTDDVADWDGAGSMIEMAVHEFGGLDVLVNNAGVLCDRTLVNMEPEELDVVTRVHVRGTFAPAHHAADYWRNGSNAGRRRAQRLINTSSSSGLYCNPGQTNDGAAKAGIAAMTVIASRELNRYWVTINAIYPTAKSRLTADIFAANGATYNAGAVPGFAPLDPANVAPLVACLGSVQSGAVNRVLGVLGGRITVAEAGMLARGSIRAAAGASPSSADRSPGSSPRRRATR